VHLGGGIDEIVANELAVHRGTMPERPFVLVGQQYLADPSRSVGDVHPVWSYAHVPNGYTGDATDAIVTQIERFAPGFRDRVVGTAVRSATEMAAYNPNYVGGDVIGGASSPTQLVFRPRVALDPYATGIAGTYLCSASTPPGAGAHGMCGANAAARALAALRRR
jgi:phytoene dehydrogenase-like protein